MKVEAPKNSLGPYLTRKLRDKGQDSTNISALTGIHVETLRKMRNGTTKSIPAIESWKIALFVGDPIDVYLREVYPNLNLQYTDKPLSKSIKGDTSDTGILIFSLEDFNLDILAYRTGIKRDRLYRLTKLGFEKIETYELALIEMAADKEPGELFNELFKDVELKAE
ncbi:hypothetical protein H8S90_10485 [Olivibacter sp. SDN3]|uniref:hypothetical protein n=1 Tax=Olivibacter sp. SDN3 TaxID=2764720 RepID=UPI0016517E36|nr:hypothetical protein [Olivibacter sp. SDN3]QNL51961.1 hypothetical protein H8S90_10485 [Olivibacter sp. SDN3]